MRDLKSAIHRALSRTFLAMIVTPETCLMQVLIPVLKFFVRVIATGQPIGDKKPLVFEAVDSVFSTQADGHESAAFYVGNNDGSKSVGEVDIRPVG